MKRNKFTEEQIVLPLVKNSLPDLLMKYVVKWEYISKPFYQWKKRFGGLESRELCRLRQLEK